MASYHLSVKVGAKGKAAAHAEYIEREGEYKLKNKEIIREKAREYYQKNKERISLQQKEYHARKNGIISA